MEIVTLLATKIMDWHLHEEEIYGFSTFCWKNKKNNVVTDFYVEAKSCWNPYGNFEDALMLIDKMIEKDFIFTLYYYPKSSFFEDEEYIPYRAVFGSSKEPEVYESKSDDLCSAICEAVCKYLENKNG